MEPYDLDEELALAVADAVLCQEVNLISEPKITEVKRVDERTIDVLYTTDEQLGVLRHQIKNGRLLTWFLLELDTEYGFDLT